MYTHIKIHRINVHDSNAYWNEMIRIVTDFDDWTYGRTKCEGGEGVVQRELVSVELRPSVHCEHMISNLYSTFKCSFFRYIRYPHSICSRSRYFVCDSHFGFKLVITIIASISLLPKTTHSHKPIEMWCVSEFLVFLPSIYSVFFICFFVVVVVFGYGQ